MRLNKIQMGGICLIVAGLLCLVSGFYTAFSIPAVQAQANQTSGGIGVGFGGFNQPDYPKLLASMKQISDLSFLGGTIFVIAGIALFVYGIYFDIINKHPLFDSLNETGDKKEEP